MSGKGRSSLDLQYQNEAIFSRQVIEFLRPLEREGIKTLRIVDRYTRGYSDLFLCVNGRFVILELKTATGKASPHQEAFIKEMRAAGAVGGVCRSLRDVVDYIKEARGAN